MTIARLRMEFTVDSCNRLGLSIPERIFTIAKGANNFSEFSVLCHAKHALENCPL